MRKISSDTWIRTILLIIALINQALAIVGKSPLPVSDETVTQLLSLVFTVVTSLVAWWKNNSFTQAALAGDELMKQFKEDK